MESTITLTQQSHKHHNHGNAICPSYGVVSKGTPNRMQLTCSEEVGRGRLRWVLYKSLKQSSN